MSALVLVLDQGGHSSRALVFDEAGAVVAQSAVAVSTQYPAPGWVEQSPRELCDSLDTVLAAVAAQLGPRCRDLVSAALIVQRSSMLAWDKTSGTPLCPVISWQDTRNSSWLERCIADRRQILRDETGLYANAHYGASKMRWLLANVMAVQEAFRDGRLCMAPLSSFLHRHLTGAEHAVVDGVIASRTLLTSRGSLAWSASLLALFSIPETVLPAVVPSLGEYGILRCGECSVSLRLMGGDQSFFALAHGRYFDNNTVMINVGTGAFLQQRVERQPVPHALLCAPLMLAELADESVLVAEGTVNAAATALDWWSSSTGVAVSPEYLQHCCAVVDSSQQDIPFFINRVTASGSPDWLPAGHSMFSFDASATQQVVSVLEGIVFALQRNIDCLSLVNVQRRVVISGGLSRLDAICQRLADLAGIPVLRSEDAEACARGAAVQLLPAIAQTEARYDQFDPVDNIELRCRYRSWSQCMDKQHADQLSG